MGHTRSAPLSPSSTSQRASIGISYHTHAQAASSERLHASEQNNPRIAFTALLRLRRETNESETGVWGKGNNRHRLGGMPTAVGLAGCPSVNRQEGGRQSRAASKSSSHWLELERAA